ncbi:hmmtag2 [Schizosaccharomyces octosporus yFS286]|uniref:Hmmtag2 n=1 Tax=Schizosaccharomyces octosporus (strain yFS286) TaxID=483514 RepID=S9PSR9_SCHOY|nr:hmmtag2 [Schizosaccharomyces octosporus yFS286]EPX72186.1 hmmtag2 [Schizosaccharomyces octosporus yFS286]
MGRSNATRGGTRGGQGEFQWDQVKGDKQKGNYLGQSIYAASGRWAQGRDLEWWSKGRTTQAESGSNNEDAYRKEILEIKHKEQTMIAEALGLPPPPPLGSENSSQKPETTTKDQHKQRSDSHHRRISHRKEHSHRRSRSRSPSPGARSHRRERPREDDYYSGRYKSRRQERYSSIPDHLDEEISYNDNRNFHHRRRQHSDEVPQRDYKKAYFDRSPPRVRQREH